MRQPDDIGGSFSRLCMCCQQGEAMGANKLCIQCQPNPESWVAHLLRDVGGRISCLGRVVRRVLREARSLCAWLEGEA